MELVTAKLNPIRNGNIEKQVTGKQITVRWGMVVCILYMIGTSVQLKELFGLPDGSELFLILLTVAVSLLCGLTYRLEKTRKLDQGIPYAAVLLLVILMGGHVIRGVLGVLNQLLNLWNTKYHDGKVLFQVNDLTQRDLVMTAAVLCCLMLAVVWHGITVKRLRWAYGMVLILTVLGLVLGNVSPIVFVFEITAIVGLWLFCVSDQMDLRRVLWTVVTGVTVLAVTLGFVGNLNWVDEVKVHTAKEFEYLSYGEDTLPQGDLYAAHGIHTDRTGDKPIRLTVTVDEKKDIYLRGYVGDSYRDGRWNEFSGDVYGGNSKGMLRWLEERDFLPESQYAAYVEAGEHAEDGNHVRVENVNASRKYVYVPYSASELTGHRIKAHKDGGYSTQRFIGIRKYEYQDYSENLPAELNHVEAWVKNPATDHEKKYMEAEEVYRQFVYDNYLEIDSDLKPLIQQAFHDANEQNIDYGIYTATVKIRESLEKIAAYRKNMESVPKDKDPIRWFLTESGEGNETLYASTTVMAFRSFGIPARYVEGYLLRSDAEGEAGTKQTLTSDQAHAWCEVYMDGLGWIPVDTVPGYYYDTYAMIEMLNAAMEIKQATAEEESKDQADQILDEQNRNRAQKTPEIIKKAERVAEGIFVIVIILLVMIGVILVLLRLYLLWRCNWSLTRGNRTKDVKRQCRRVTEMLAALGISAGVGWKVEEAEEELRMKLPGFTEGELKSVNEVMERYIYGEMELRRYEERLILRFLEKTLREIGHLKFKEQIRFHLKDTWQLLTGKMI